MFATPPSHSSACTSTSNSPSWRSSQHSSHPTEDTLARVLSYATQPDSVERARHVLGLACSEPITLDRIGQALRAVRLELHPDRTSDPIRKQVLTQATQLATSSAQTLERQISRTVDARPRTSTRPAISDSETLSLLKHLYLPRAFNFFLIPGLRRAFDKFLGRPGAWNEFRSDPEGFFEQHRGDAIGERLRQLAECVSAGR